MLAACALLAACSTGKSQVTPEPAPTSTSATSTSPVPQTSSDTATAPSSLNPSPTDSLTTGMESSGTATLMPPPPSTTSSTVTPPAASVAPQIPPCAASQVALDVLRGGATLGQELAGISVTNTSATACSIQGSPSVQLMLGGKPLGAKITMRYDGEVVVLRPGDQAQSQVTNRTTNCSAPVSDSAQIVLPNTSKVFTTKQMALRDCSVKVSDFSTD